MKRIGDDLPDNCNKEILVVDSHSMKKGSEELLKTGKIKLVFH